MDPLTVTAPEQITPPSRAAYRAIFGTPPSIDPRTIQQRGTLVDTIITQLAQPDLNALILTGSNGVGKSTLAAMIYHLLREEQSNDLSSTPLWLTIDVTTTFTDLMGTLYQALGKPLPDLSRLSPINQAQALFFTLSTAPARLIIIDQCEQILDSKTGQALADRPSLAAWLDILNIQPFATGSRLLLTSRQRPRGSRTETPIYLQSCPVGGLSTSEGVELFQMRGIQALETDMQQAVTVCNGHALALTLLINLIQTYDLPLADLLADLTLWEGDITGNLLNALFQQLNAPQRALLHAFAAYRFPVPLEAAQAILAPERQQQTIAILKDLLNLRLLQKIMKTSYQPHMLVTRHARQDMQQANQQGVQEAHKNAAHYYKEASVSQCPPREQRRGLKDSHPLLEAIWHLTQANHWQEAYELATEERVFDALEQGRAYIPLLELCQQFLTSKEWRSQPTQTALLYGYQGNAYRILGKNAQALQYLEVALAIHRALGDPHKEGTILNYLGQIALASGKPAEALAYFQQRLALSQQLQDRHAEGEALANIGKCYNRTGKHRKALYFYKQALAIYRALGAQREEGKTLHALGGLYHTSGKKAEAIRSLEQALAIYRTIGERQEEGTILNNLGFIYTHIGKRTEALLYYKQALAICQAVGDREGTGPIFTNLGFAYIALGQQTEALHYFEAALDLFREVGNREGEGTILNALGGIYQALEKQTEAIEHLERALVIYQETGNVSEMGTTLNNLGLAHHALSNETQALQCYEHALTTYRETGRRAGEGSTLWNIGLLFFEQSQYKFALTALLLARQIFEKAHNPLWRDVERSITHLYHTIGETSFLDLLTQIEPHLEDILAQALSSKKKREDAPKLQTTH